MPPLARLFFLLAGALLLAGLITILFSRLNLPFSRLSLGHLPGDLAFRGRGWSLFLPLGTSLLLSVLLSFVFWAIRRLL